MPERLEQTLTGGIGNHLSAQQIQLHTLTQSLGKGTGELLDKVDWEPGDVIDGKYEVLAILGQGAMGVVYKVYHREWKLELAVKMPIIALLEKSLWKQRFLLEAQTWVDLGLHPNIVQCWYVRELGGIPRVFMDYLDGGSLRDWIKKGKVLPGEWEKILDLVMQACDGLRYAHEHGVEVHRDVKPGNLLLTGSGALRVTDFGIAKRTGIPEYEGQTISVVHSGRVHSMTMTGTDMGTPEYSAPEQWGQARHADARADIYALGVVLFELCCGRRPFDAGQHEESTALVISRHLMTPAPDPRTLNRHVPKALAKLIQRCLAKKPEHRPVSMAQLRGELVEIYEQVVGKPYRRVVPEAAELRANALNNRAVSLLDLGRGEEACSVWDEALRLDAYHPESVYNKAIYEWHIGRIADDEVIRRLVPLKQATTRISWYLALIHLERAAADQAEQELRFLLNSPGGMQNQATWRAFGDACMAQGKYPEAAQAYQRILDMRAEDPRVLEKLNMAHEPLREEKRRILFPWRACQHILDGHRLGVTTLAITPDGRYLISGSRDKTLRIWDLQNRKYLSMFPLQPDQITAVALSPDGSLLISGSRDASLRCWNLHTRELLGALSGHQASISAVTFTPDGQYLVSASRDATLRVWNPKTCMNLRVLKGHQDQVTGIALTPDGKYALSGSEDGSRRVWEIPSGKCLRKFKGKWYASFVNRFEALVLAVTPDGHYAVSGGWDSTVKFWDIKTGEKLWSTPGHQGRVTSIAITPDGQYALSGSEDAALCLWDLQRGIALQTYKGHTAPIHAVLISPDGQTAISGSEDHTIRGWELDSSRPLWTFEGYQGHQKAVTALAISPRGDLGASGGQDATLKIWELPSSRCIHTFQAHRHKITGLHFTPDGRHVASASVDTSIHLWNLDTAACVQTLTGHEQAITAFAFSRDGTLLLSGSADATLRAWDLQTGQCCQLFRGHQASILALTLTPDAHYIFSASEDKTVRIWERASGACLKIFENFEFPVTALALTPDGQTLVLGDSEAHIWKVGLTTSEASQIFCGHYQQISSLTVVCDGRFLFSASEDATLRLWDMASARCLRTYEAPQKSIGAPALNGKLALSAGEDGVLRIWTLEPDAQYHAAPIQVSRHQSHKELQALKEHFQHLIQWAQNALEARKLSAAYKYVIQARALAGYERASRALDLNSALGLLLPRKTLRGGWNVRVFSGHQGAVSALAVTPDGRLALSGSGDATLRAWDLENASCARVFTGHTQKISALTITPDGGFVVSTSKDRTVRLWDVSTAKCVRCYTGHTRGVLAVTVSSCGRFLLSGSADGTMRLWNPATAKCLQIYKGGRKPITAVKITPETDTIVSGDSGGIVRIWNLTTGECIYSFRGHTKSITAMAMSSDGRYLITGSQDTLLRLWNVASRECLLTIKKENAEVTCLTITPDSQFLISGNQKNMLHVRKLKTGELCGSFEGHRQRINAVALTPSMRYILSVSDDLTMRMWELDWELEAASTRI